MTERDRLRSNGLFCKWLENIRAKPWMTVNAVLWSGNETRILSPVRLPVSPPGRGRPHSRTVAPAHRVVGQVLGGWQREGEDRSPAQLAGDADGASVGLDDGFCDRQAHAGALDAVALVLAAVELVEDQGLLEVIDAGAAVGHADDHLPVPRLGGDADGTVRR